MLVAPLAMAPALLFPALAMILVPAAVTLVVIIVVGHDSSCAARAST